MCFLPLCLLDLLEFEACNLRSGEWKRDAGFIGLVVKVPDVDGIGLRDEYDTRSTGRETSACVVGAESIR